MIKQCNHMGDVSISGRYLKKLVADEVSSCFGVAGLNKVSLSVRDKQINVTLHIDCADEINIPAVFNAVTHKVGYVLTQKTGVKVGKINVYVDDIL